MYRFSGDGRTNGVNGMNGHAEFTFRSGEQRDFQRGPPPPQGPARGLRRQRGRDDRRFQGRQNFQPRRYGPKPAHERQILHADNDREGTPERLMGMAQGASQFKPVDDLFVSDSDSDSAMDLESPATEDEPASKRTRTDDNNSDVTEKPKWSNPDPYYLLPPVDESHGKRRDVVQLIRKAKLETEKAARTFANAVTRNADFISFGDGEGDEVSLNEPSEEGEIDSAQQGSRDLEPLPSKTPDSRVKNSAQASNRVPTPTSSFSHFRHMHQIPDPKCLPALDSLAQTSAATSDDILREAREMLNELAAKDDVQPQKQMSDMAHHDKKRKLGADGEITKSWMARDRDSSTPWYIDHSTAPSTTFW
jgi:non-canonical poly(A) RNA polymerase PAPD5/7